MNSDDNAKWECKGTRGTGWPLDPESGTILTLENGDKYLWLNDTWNFIGYPKPTEDPVSNPSHYTRFRGIEVIQLTENLNFCRGNAVKYIARAGAKDASKEIEDLEKAAWYLEREINRIKELCSE